MNNYHQNIQFIINDENKQFNYQIKEKIESPYISTYQITMSRAEKAFPQPIQLNWYYPAIDIAGYWDPGAQRQKGIRTDFDMPFTSKSTSLAPVVCFYNEANLNKLTIALSDALNAIQIRAGIKEETAQIELYFLFFSEASPPIDSYSFEMRIDISPYRYEQALSAVTQWWSMQPGYEPAKVPEIAKLPMYSTWYSYHQQLQPHALLEECRLAKQLGCKAIIVDDGWQTSNSERGYAYCGDWRVSPERISDMRSFVKSVHDLDMKFLLWYSVPFVGKYRDAWKRFEGKFISYYDSLTAVLDPRFPEVREYLISIYEQALIKWDLDGFKLDFVDSFLLSDEMKYTIGEGRDFDSVPMAVDQLLSDTINRLRAIKPDIMIEFRQKYIGPLMRKYGNMFRVADCPNNYSQNRIGSIDIRMLAANTAVHSDMMMWHPLEKDENVARQFAHALFSVPQISMRLAELTKNHLQVVAFWLEFWQQHRHTLLNSDLYADSPHLLYPLVCAESNNEKIFALYQPTPIELTAKKKHFIVNATSKTNLLVNQSFISTCQVTIYSCQGSVIFHERLDLNKDFSKLTVPQLGIIELTYE